MPIGFRNFRSIPTKLKLNGPDLRFIENPSDGSEQINGTATFVAKVIADFPGSTVAASGGYSFNWYFDGNKLDPNNEFVKIITGTGSSTTLILTNINVEDNNKLVYCEATYLPTKKEGVPLNSPLKSNTATLSAFPELEITTQPVSSIVGSNVDAKYTCIADLLPTTVLQDVKYQWQINGIDLVDGVSDANGVAPVGSIMKVTSDKGDDFEIDFETVTTFTEWKVDRTYTLVCTGEVVADLYAIGGGGGGSGYRDVRGSSGGAAQGKFTFLKDQVYKLQIGDAGGDGINYENGSITVPGGFPGGGDAPSNSSSFNRSGGGGGYTGLFINSVEHSNSILIGAGGGGSSGDPGTGGDGGGDVGSPGSNGCRAGTGGTQTAGGTGGSCYDPGSPGSALQGGKGATIGNGAGGGGGGYYGGGGGTTGGPGTGGGGSSYFHPTLITNGSYSRENSNQPQLNYEEKGSFKLVKISASVPSKITVSGSQTSQLRIRNNSTKFGSDIRCKVSSESAQFSPIFSNTVNFQSTTSKPIIVLEAYDTINNAYSTREQNLNSSPLTLNSQTFGSQFNLIQFYSKEGNFNFNLYITASAGAGQPGADGGEGGTSTIQINAKRQTEYSILGISNNSAIFIYEKARLIACVGQGGDAGRTASGGDGGGVNVDGRPGDGISLGLGGERPVTGTLKLTGSYGSILSGSNVNLYDGDTIETQQDGGTTISCTKGSYYINQGFSPCEDISSELIQFTSNSGFLFSSSSELYRGFKSGYTITDTAGASSDDTSGRGGNGATGGEGGSNRSGGGGGSGYVDDSVVVISTAIGGNTRTISEITFLDPTVQYK